MEQVRSISGAFDEIRNATDARGRAIDEQLGASLQRIRGFDPVSGRIEYIQTGPGGNAAVQNLVYQWDGVGNLAWRRDDNQNLTEAFGYDHLHRLTSSTLNGTNNLSVAYNALGNITSKTGVGTYTYHATRKHAVVSTSSGGSYAYDANGNMTSRNGSTISWSSFNLPTVIHGSGSNSSQFFYTPDRARYKQVANYAGSTETTIYVGGLLEKLSRGALTEFRHLIQAGQEHTVIYTRRSNGTTETFHVTRDHLGSAAAITDAGGNVLVQESFTAFGARRGANWSGSPSSADWTQIANTTRRGFTDHEHLDNLNLIHMNGRVYDPGLGRFLSADPFIDGWTSTQGYNRYSYVHNNPLRFRDPSGFRKKNPDERDESEGSGGSGHQNPSGKPIEQMVVKEPRPNWSKYIFTDAPGGGEHVNPNGEPMEEMRVTAPRYGYQGAGRTSYSSYSTFPSADGTSTQLSWHSLSGSEIEEAFAVTSAYILNVSGLIADRYMPNAYVPLRLSIAGSSFGAGHSLINGWRGTTTPSYVMGLMNVASGASAITIAVAAAPGALGFGLALSFSGGVLIGTGIYQMGTKAWFGSE